MANLNEPLSEENKLTPPEVEDHLTKMYEPLHGKCFDGNYAGSMGMKTTGNCRSVIIVEDPDMKSVIEEIASTVEKHYPSKVWKGITCPGYGSIDGDYKLWVVPLSAGLNLVEEKRYRFRVKSWKAYHLKVPGREFRYGVNINLELFSD